MTLALEPDGLYHLATSAEWAQAQTAGDVAPASLATEGFVHCSWGRQVAETVGRHFVGVNDLLALRLDPAQLGATTVVEEDTTGSGQVFPHLYGVVPVAAVVAVVRIRSGE